MQESRETRCCFQKEQHKGCNQLQLQDLKAKKSQKTVGHLLRWRVLTIGSDIHSNAVRLNLVRRPLAAASRPCWRSPLLCRILRLVLALLVSRPRLEVLLGMLRLLRRVLLLGKLLRLGVLL